MTGPNAVGMTIHRITELVRILDRSFEGSEHALLANLATVTGAEWTVRPPGAARSIRDIAQHVGLFSYMYANHGFRDATMDYGDAPATPPPERLATPGTAVDWLREAHAYLREAIVELAEDRELDRRRKAHWGGMVPTILLIDTMHEHDIYRAGEINRTRGMLQGRDGWYVPG